MTDSLVFGWDIGGAHVKTCRLQRGRVADVAMWACPLWLGMDRLTAALGSVAQRWPDIVSAQARHAVTMTGEMVDLFAHREQGVMRIASLLEQQLAGPVRFFADDGGWPDAAGAAAQWQQVASANWLATARHAALAGPGATQAGLLVDIGSTTTDLVAFGRGRVLSQARSDAQRLASGELVYHGVVRTPLCALARRIRWRDHDVNVMNEWFATTADVYRLTGELDPAHDLHESADHAAKNLSATRQRLARMVGLDARDGTADDWLAFAQAWRAAQVAELAAQVQRVWQLHRLPPDAPVVSAGCGEFLVPDVLAQALQRAPGEVRCHAYGTEVARLAAPGPLAAWAQVCAPSVAVAALFDKERR